MSRTSGVVRARCPLSSHEQADDGTILWHDASLLVTAREGCGKEWRLRLEEVLQRCRFGDDLAWEELVRRFQGRVFGIAVHYLRDREEARDAAQEVFLKVYRQLGSVQSTDTFIPWLLRLARNSCIDRLRRNASRTPPGQVSDEAAGDVADQQPSPEELGIRSAQSQLLYSAIGRLSHDSREMILLKEIQQLKVREIAQMLDVPVGTIKSRSHRARLELADRLRELTAVDGAR